MKSSSSLLASAMSILTAQVSAHGNITSPPARQAGAAMAALCGQAAVDTVNADPTAPIENLPAEALASADCNAFLCRGATFEDQPAESLQQFTAGQAVPMTAILPIPHAGPMNVSIIQTASNTVLSGPLISFDVYADESLAQLPANNTDFSVTMPDDLGTACTQAGDCVLQWFWFGTNAKQTYESCVDFVMV